MRPDRHATRGAPRDGSRYHVRPAGVEATGYVGGTYEREHIVVRGAVGRYRAFTQIGVEID
jgi:hypothetical protein